MATIERKGENYAQLGNELDALIRELDDLFDERFRVEAEILVEGVAVQWKRLRGDWQLCAGDNPLLERSLSVKAKFVLQAREMWEALEGAERRRAVFIEHALIEGRGVLAELRGRFEGERRAAKAGGD